MDHSTSAIFERNYLSRMIRYDTQAAYLGNSHETDFIRAASRMNRWMDPRRPRKLSDEQREEIKREKEVRDLYDCKNQLLDEIREAYGPIAKAKGEGVYDDYVAVNRAIHSKFRMRERAVLKQSQADYDAEAPLKDIREQLAGSAEFLEPVSLSSTTKHAFVERSCIAKAAFYDGSVFTAKDWFPRRLEIVNSLMALCALRERRPPRIYLKRKATIESLETQTKAPSKSKKRKLALECLEDQASTPPESASYDPSSDSCKPAGVQDFSIICSPYQCLFCIGSPDLPLDERLREYKNKFSLQRHIQRCGFRFIHSEEAIPCPHPHPRCDGVSLHGVMHFKNHAAKIHGIFL